ncbi:helix-turn-helix domain-containing protein [Spiroplasma endosymbiont of Nebria brevicollis]|uniref:helix-turn-helix domain-containing protein n=1 Tax=Spiroplasma endosymbiont of Nebria brevicollis TaxID=3066284 RepID=UPI00313D8546
MKYLLNLSSSCRKEIVRLFRNGTSVKELANNYGVSTHQISNILRDFIKYGDKSFTIRESGKQSFNTLLSEEQQKIHLLEKKIKKLEVQEELSKKLETYLEQIKTNKSE